MKVELKKISFNERMSEETNAFVAKVYVDGKSCGDAKNDGRGGCTWVQPYGKHRDLFVMCEQWLTEQPDINIGTEETPFMVKSNMENVVDQLFEQWLKDRDKKKMEKKMETSLMWGVPNGHSYHLVSFKKPLNTIDRVVLQRYIDTYKKEFKDGEQWLNTNLIGFEL